MPPRYFKIILFLLLAFSRMAFLAQKPDETDTRAIMQANFIYQFAANNNWPIEVRKGKFNIGVVGNSAIYEHLSEKYGTKPIGTQTIEIGRLNEVPTTPHFHIIFIDKSRKNELAKAVKEFKGTSTLIVTNWEGALQSGSMINFKNIDGSVRYEMNQSIMEEHHITPGVKILQWKVD